MTTDQEEEIWYDSEGCVSESGCYDAHNHYSLQRALETLPEEDVEP